MPLREELDSLAEVCFNWRVKSHGAFFSRKRVTLGFYIVDIMVLHNGKSSEGLELKSLLFSQLSTRSYNFCSGFQRLYESHNNGAHKPTGSVLFQNTSRHPPFQIAARSCWRAECPNTFGMPYPRELFLNFVKELCRSFPAGPGPKSSDRNAL